MIVCMQSSELGGDTGQWRNSIGTGRAVATPLFDGSKLKITIEWPTTTSNVTGAAELVQQTQF